MDKPLPYTVFYWGPLLCKIKIKPEHLKECAKLCSKKSNLVTETLAGVIKQEHYVSPNHYLKIISPYLDLFQNGYQRWYAKPMFGAKMVSAWVNFMVAGEFNPPHIHMDCDFSSILFIKLPEKLKEENQKFVGNGGGPGSISFTHGEAQPHSIWQMDFPPEEGDFYIFPATLTHFVTPFRSEGERISMSANFKVGLQNV